MQLNKPLKVKVERLKNNPIITPHMDDRMGENINGPSLIETPEWLPNRLGKFYLYFGHHDGRYIRLAYSDVLEGPWQIYSPGTLQLEESHFSGHIASPDVHVDDDRKQIRMYFHGSDTRSGHGGEQFTRAAFSDDGLKFQALPEELGNPYMRVVEHKGASYGVAMPNTLYRSVDGITDFEKGLDLGPADSRHCALMALDDQLIIAYTVIGEAPERIYISMIDTAEDWRYWSLGDAQEILRPEVEWEGSTAPKLPSKRGLIEGKTNQLRDPSFFNHNDMLYMLYAVAEETCIAISKLNF